MGGADPGAEKRIPENLVMSIVEIQRRATEDLRKVRQQWKSNALSTPAFTKAEARLWNNFHRDAKGFSETLLEDMWADIQKQSRV